MVLPMIVHVNAFPCSCFPAQETTNRRVLSQDNYGLICTHLTTANHQRDLESRSRLTANVRFTFMFS